MAPELTNALTSVENVALWLNRTNRLDDLEVRRVELLINVYSAAVNRYCERQFRPLETAAAKVFRYDGAGVLDLAPYELRTVTSIQTYTDQPTASWQTLAAQTPTASSLFRLEPRNKTGELTYWWLALPRLSVPYASAHTGLQVTITGDWGVTTVPPDVEGACLIAVSNAFRNPEGFATRSLGELQFSEEISDPASPQSLPPDARALLGPFRRIHL